MTILAKYSNRNHRLNGFSLIEILTVLVIVGVILTIPRWPLMSSNLLNRVSNKIQTLQINVDTAILTQSNPSSQKIITVHLDPICPSKSIQVFLGGWLKPISIKCKGKTLRIDALGKIMLETP